MREDSFIRAMRILRPIAVNADELKDVGQGLQIAKPVDVVRCRERAVDIKHHQMHGSATPNCRKSLDVVNQRFAAPIFLHHHLDKVHLL